MSETPEELGAITGAVGDDGGIRLHGDAAQLEALARVVESDGERTLTLGIGAQFVTGYPHKLRTLSVTDGGKRLLISRHGDTLAVAGDRAARNLLARNLRALVGGEIQSDERAAEILGLYYFPGHPLLAEGSDEVDVELLPVSVVTATRSQTEGRPTHPRA